MGGDGDQLVDKLSCFSQSELGPAVLKVSAHFNQCMYKVRNAF